MKTPRYLALVGLLAVFVAPVLAQRNLGADAKKSGDAHRHGRARTFQRHAQDRALLMYYGGSPQLQMAKADTREMLEGLRRDLVAADKAIAELKQSHAQEPEVVKAIALVEKHDSMALEACGKAEKESAKEKGDDDMVADYCVDIWNEMEAASADMDMLASVLKVEKMPPPKKLAKTK